MLGKIRVSTGLGFWDLLFFVLLFVGVGCYMFGRAFLGQLISKLRRDGKKGGVSIVVELPNGSQIEFDRTAWHGLMQLCQQGTGSYITFGRMNRGYYESFVATYDGERVIVEYFQSEQTSAPDPNQMVGPFGGFMLGGEWERIPGSTMYWDWTPTEVVDNYREGGRESYGIGRLD